MNKKEVLEIRKQLTPVNCAITRICGCYVDHEKTKRMQMKEAFLSMPEEEGFKYFDMLRKTLSRKNRKKSAESGNSARRRAAGRGAGVSLYGCVTAN